MIPEILIITLSFNLPAYQRQRSMSDGQYLEFIHERNTDTLYGRLCNRWVSLFTVSHLYNNSNYVILNILYKTLFLIEKK